MLPPRTSDWPICPRLYVENRQVSGRAPLRPDVALADYLERQGACRRGQAGFEFGAAGEHIKAYAAIFELLWRFGLGKSARQAGPQRSGPPPESDAAFASIAVVPQRVRPLRNR